MDNQYAKQVLKEFIKRDRMLRKNSVKSDYDKFCETTCRAIETILAENEELKSKYDRALSYLVKAEKEKNELKEENIKLKNHCKEKIKEKQELTSALLDSIPVSLIKDIIEENKSYLEYANTAYEYTQREVIEKNIKILQKLIGDD